MSQCSNNELKAEVQAHWERETCGTRYADENEDGNRERYFDEISAARYRLEPYIPSFAEFPAARGKRVLEIGVGAGADFENWCRHAAHATGIDLTERAVKLSTERLRAKGVPPECYTLQRADSESLPFADGSFDLVYSWGALHHTPNTVQAFGEACRVLKPGGTLKAMVYHATSWTGFLLYLQHGVARGHFLKTQQEILFDHLESPGTKSYTPVAAERFLREVGFTDISISTKLGPGDLLTIKPSYKYQSVLFKTVWMFYPRWLVRLCGDKYGLNLCIQARKPDA
jgi:ubiquinone/menaquinone biosynthesis C-methylase UbiE